MFVSSQYVHHFHLIIFTLANNFIKYGHEKRKEPENIFLGTQFSSFDLVEDKNEDKNGDDENNAQHKSESKNGN